MAIYYVPSNIPSIFLAIPEQGRINNLAPTGIVNDIQSTDMMKSLITDFVTYHQIYPHAV
jgi:hypothetical protein